MLLGFIPGHGAADTFFIDKQLLSNQRKILFPFVALNKACDQVFIDLVWWVWTELGRDK